MGIIHLQADCEAGRIVLIVQVNGYIAPWRMNLLRYPQPRRPSRRMTTMPCAQRCGRPRVDAVSLKSMCGANALLIPIR